MTNEKLIELAKEAMGRAYAPFSHFQVGAALLVKVDGEEKVYLGCNIENSSYTPTICAERVAIFKAVSEGVRKYEQFVKIAIVGGQNGEISGYAAPCGVCRQVMMEFCHPDKFEIVLGGKDDQYAVYTLRDLLPLGFRLEDAREGIYN